MDELKNLASDDFETKLAAIRQAHLAPSASVLKPLCDIVLDADQGEPVRHAAVEALGRLPDQAGRAMLLELLRDTDDPRRRMLGALGLGQLAHADIVGPLVEALGDEVNTVRNVAERSLLERIDLVRGHGIEPLLALLASSDPLVRSPAARLLGATQDDRAREPLMAILRNDREWLSRMWAAKALGDLGRMDAADLLHERLDHDEKNRVRAAAAEAIGKLKPASGAAWLLHALEHDDDGGVRKLASEALRQFGLDVDEAEEIPEDSE